MATKPTFDVTMLVDLPIWKTIVLGGVHIDLISLTLENLLLGPNVSPEEVHDYLEWSEIVPPADELREKICEQHPELKGVEIFFTSHHLLQRQNVSMFVLQRQPPIAVPELVK